MASDRQKEEAFRIQEPNHINVLEDPRENHDTSLNDHSGIVNMFQQENVQLLDDISPMQIKEQEGSPGCSSTEQTEATLSEFEEQHEMRNQLQKVQKDNSTLSAGLAAAQHQALYFEARAHDLTHALQSSPNEFANIRGVLEQKDRMFSDLEKKGRRVFRCSG